MPGSQERETCPTCQQSTRFDFVINLKEASQITLCRCQSMRVQAKPRRPHRRRADELAGDARRH
jgi:hypothetical protein